MFSPALMLKAERTDSPFSLSDFGYGDEATGNGNGMPRRLLQQTRKAIGEARVAFYPNEERQRRKSVGVASSSSSSHSQAQGQSGFLTPEQRQPGLGHTNENGHGHASRQLGHGRSTSLPNPARIVSTSTEDIGVAIGQAGPSKRTSSLNLTAVTRPSAGVDKRPAGWKYYNANKSSLSLPLGSSTGADAGEGGSGSGQGQVRFGVQLPGDANEKRNGDDDHAFMKKRVDEIEAQNSSGAATGVLSHVGGRGGGVAAAQTNTGIGFPFRMHSPPLVKRKSLPPGAAISFSPGPAIVKDAPQVPQTPQTPPLGLETSRDKGKGKQEARVDSGQYESAGPSRGTAEGPRHTPLDSNNDKGDELKSQKKREITQMGVDQARRKIWPERGGKGHEQESGENGGEDEAQGEAESANGDEGNSERESGSRSRRDWRPKSLLRDVGSSERAEWGYLGEEE